MSQRSITSKPRKVSLLIRAFRESRPMAVTENDIIRGWQWERDARAVAAEQYADNPSFDVPQFLRDIGIETDVTDEQSNRSEDRRRE